MSTAEARPTSGTPTSSSSPERSPGDRSPESGSPEDDAFLAKLRAFEGAPNGQPLQARDEVNQAMIRHWVDAMGDDNPVYVDAEVARAHGLPGVIAPPTMLQAWTMRGYRSPDHVDSGGEGSPSGASDEPSAQQLLFALLDEAGFTSVVATDCEQEYARPLALGDRLTVSSMFESISPEKHTALGDGHFVTTRLQFTDQDGDVVATMRFRILRFRPRRSERAEPKALRPRPALTQDNAFFFEGARAGTLLIQRCTVCGTLRHPPRPACPACGAFEWDTVRSPGRGTVYSFVVVHHPQIPSFDYPLPIAVIELEEGTRLVADLVGVAPDDVHIGMPVQVEMVAVDDELTLPMFRPVTPAGSPR